MAYVIYQDHTIVSSAVYDQVSGKWKVTARIMWDESGSLAPRLHLITTSPELFSRFEEAETAGMESAKNWVDLAKQQTELVVRSCSGCAEQRDRREECMPPMDTSEYKPNIKLQEAILHVTSVGHQLRKTIDASRKNIDYSRRLIKETKVVLERSRLILLARQRATFKGWRLPNDAEVSIDPMISHAD
jgi:hypothetical protein